jgi:hypothetical protein
MLPRAPRRAAYARALAATGLFKAERIVALQDNGLSAGTPRPSFAITRSVAPGTSQRVFAAFCGRTTG